MKTTIATANQVTSIEHCGGMGGFAFYDGHSSSAPRNTQEMMMYLAFMLSAKDGW